MQKKQLALVVATLLGLTVLSVAPVAADTTVSTSDNTQTTTSSGDTNVDTQTSTDATASTGETGEAPEVKAEIAKFREEALQSLQTEREKAKVHSTMEREQACVAHQKEIETRIADYSRAAQSNLNTFTNILIKVQTFYTSKGLNVSTYSSLDATAQAKEQAAQQAVDALKSLNPTLDCTQPDPAQTVATVKQAVDTARSALQDYRTAVKNLIVALEGASTAQTTTGAQSTTSTSGGNQ